MIIREKENKIWIKRLVLIIVLTLVTLLAAVWIDGLLSNADFGTILNAWGILYGAYQLKLNIMAGRLSGEFIVLITLLKMINTIITINNKIAFLITDFFILLFFIFFFCF